MEELEGSGGLSLKTLGGRKEATSTKCRYLVAPGSGNCGTRTRCWENFGLGRTPDIYRKQRSSDTVPDEAHLFPAHCRKWSFLILASPEVGTNSYPIP